MNFIRTSISRSAHPFLKSYVLKCNNVKHFCDYAPKLATEKSVNSVTLMGRVGVNPQLRGTESKPVVVFTLATNTNYKYESGEMHQKTDWHRISVFKHHLRDIVLEHLKKGARVYIEGRILYGEFTDSKGILHNTTTIIANDIIFLTGAKKPDEVDATEIENSVL